MGNLALLSDGKRHATVRAESAVELLEVTKSDLRGVAQKHPRVMKVLDEYYKKRIVDTVIQQNRLFSVLTESERQKFLNRFKFLKVTANSFYLKRGDDGGEVYFVKSGKFEVSLRRDGDVIVVANLGPGDFFGEIAMVTGQTKNRIGSCRNRR